MGEPTSECIFESDADQIGVHSKNCDGPYWSALQKLKGTIWECTPKIVRDQMGVHSKNQKGPHGSALLIPKGTKWECIRFWYGPNGSALDFCNTDHMGVHS